MTMTPEIIRAVIDELESLDREFDAVTAPYVTRPTDEQHIVRQRVLELERQL